MSEGNRTSEPSFCCGDADKCAAGCDCQCHRLAHDIERHIAITSEQAAEIERLTAELNHARAEARAMHSAYASSVKLRAADLQGLTVTSHHASLASLNKEADMNTELLNALKAVIEYQDAYGTLDTDDGEHFLTQAREAVAKAEREDAGRA